MRKKIKLFRLKSIFMYLKNHADIDMKKRKTLSTIAHLNHSRVYLNYENRIGHISWRILV